MLEKQIKEDLKTALKNKDELRVSTLRFLLAEIRNQWIQKQADLTDDEVGAIIRRQIKQREEASEAYRKGWRSDLADKEDQEAKVLSKYLPQQINEEELEKLIKEAINQVGAKGAEDFGKVMGVVMAKVKGRADGSVVAAEVKKLL